MIKLLVVENDPEKCRRIVNYIAQRSFDIRVYCIAYNEKEAIGMINSEKVDLILLDLDLPKLSGFNIIKHITKNEMKKYENAIFAICSKTKSTSYIEDNPYINSIYRKPVILGELIEKLELYVKEKLTRSDETLVKSKIKYELDKLNYNFAYNGTKFIAEMIYEIYSHPEKGFENFNRDLYPIIAKRHDRSPNTIKCDVLQATRSMVLDCKEEIIMDYFNYACSAHPTVKEVITTILNKMGDYYEE